MISLWFLFTVKIRTIPPWGNSLCGCGKTVEKWGRQWGRWAPHPRLCWVNSWAGQEGGQEDCGRVPDLPRPAAPPPQLWLWGQWVAVGVQVARQLCLKSHHGPIFSLALLCFSLDRLQYCLSQGWHLTYRGIVISQMTLLCQRNDLIVSSSCLPFHRKNFYKCFKSLNIIVGSRF